MKSSKGQISMFIIISVIIISAMVFLVFMSNDSKKEEISRGTDVDTQERVLFIKGYVDSCMEKQLEKALIVSGLKGGFIYGVPNGIYRKSFIYPVPYPYHFIGNIGLDWDSLKWNLVHARELRIGITVPYLVENVNRSIYNETVKSHFERYFYEEFGKNCQHKIINETLDVREFGVELDPGQVIASSNTLLDDVSVYNLNSTATVNVSFNKDETEVKFLYPIVLNGSRGDSVEFVESVVSVPVRFGALRFLSQDLMNKKMDNRSINLSNSTQLNNILRNISKVRAFIDNLSELTFKIHKINDSPEYKEYVYYFFDDGSKILGNPYVYRFGYRNHAPSFNLSVLCANITDDECILAYVADNGSWWNSTINISARMDPEVMDCRPPHYYGSGDSGDCGNVRYVDLKPSDIFNLSTQGNYTFKAEKEGKYDFNIQLTDGEAYTIQRVYFIVGTPANFNNNDVIDCIKFYNYKKPGFPIEASFKWRNDEVRIFTNFSSGRTEAYAYALYPGKYGIKVLNSCFGKDLDFNYVEYWVNDVDPPIVVPGNKIFNISTNGSLQEIKIQINRADGTPINEENYTLTVYPFRCLGPHAINDGSENPWFMTCCNTEILNRSIYNEPNLYFKNGSGNNDFALDEEVYFCYEPYVNSQKRPRDLGYDRNFHTQNIFEYLRGSEITSLLKARVRIDCDGTSAIGNLTSIQGSESSPFPTQHVIGFGYDREIIPGLVNPGIFAGFDIEQSAGLCQFCHIPRRSNFVIKLNGSSYSGSPKPDSLILTTGLERHNNDSSLLKLGTFGDLSGKYYDPDSDSDNWVEFNKTQVRCFTPINKTFGCADVGGSCFTDGVPTLGAWSSGVRGKEFTEGQKVYMGEKFCRLDGACDVRGNLSVDIQYGEDRSYSCTDSSVRIKIRNCSFDGNEISCTESDCP